MIAWYPILLFINTHYHILQKMRNFVYLTRIICEFYVKVNLNSPLLSLNFSNGWILGIERKKLRLSFDKGI
ncbi:hypothetical protein BAVI_08141 [Neobacillus vireti LMG 21834]|uniref:Uncharacterized protein n=1 Tax=Neobacillus vireti LMG 21834 TaxID=1131730 RepID=A0AB94IQT9_9BACI|nr:hypothetical protein BAVI_08141 [Neobacillus vireti LMG 21834]KLT19814.1 hypothetical protein AA980_04425 [Neobacillus vireti]